MIRRMMKSHNRLQEESCKLIEIISKRQAKNKKLKEKPELVNNEKSSIAKELEEVKLKIANEDLINFKGNENELEQLKSKNSSLNNEVTQLKWYKERTHLIPHPLTMKSKDILCYS